MTPFVQRAQELLAEREAAETPEAKKDAEERLAALIRANYKGQSWTEDNRQRQTGEQ